MKLTPTKHRHEEKLLHPNSSDAGTTMVSFFHVLLDDEIFISPSLKYKTLSNKARQRGQELSGQNWRDATKEAQVFYPLTHPPHPSINPVSS